MSGVCLSVRSIVLGETNKLQGEGHSAGAVDECYCVK